MSTKNGRKGHPTTVTLLFDSQSAARTFVKSAGWKWNGEEGWSRDREELTFKTLSGKVEDLETHGDFPGDYEEHTARLESIKTL